MPPANQPAPTPTEPPAPKKSVFKVAHWNQIQARATTVGSVTGLFVFLISVGSIGGYYYAQSKKTPTKTSGPTVANLTPSEINQLSQIGSSLGNSGQTLNIGADTIFRSKIDVGGDLSVGGHFNANGPVTLSELNISGTTALSGLNVGSNLTVAGLAGFQKGINVAGLTAINGNLSVSGSTNLNALNATTLSVQTLTISGPLSIGHLRTQGPAPAITAGTGVGGGGTVSISGNDTAGTININTGSVPPAGILASISFRAPFGATPHILLTPLSGPAAATPAYVTRSGSAFVVHTDVSAPAGSALSYDYFVTQ
jgi:hypothetical protein